MLLYFFNLITLILCAVALGVNKPELTQASLITGIVCSSLILVCSAGMYIKDKWDECD